MSTKFTEYKGLDLPTVASSTRFWKKENIFESNHAKEILRCVLKVRLRQMDYRIHHMVARAIKDIFLDIKLKGFQVKRKAGWDTHGLRELGTEKELGIQRRYWKNHFHRRIQRSV
jgi:isoleucyl-tRNA synthetase